MEGRGKKRCIRDIRVCFLRTSERERERKGGEGKEWNEEIPKMGASF